MMHMFIANVANVDRSPRIHTPSPGYILRPQAVAAEEMVVLRMLESVRRAALHQVLE